ncbi:hypothetical protein [Vibrio vulnificus YJ016]|uniref:Uncharacterized protein n=1 Tax=Vibrio vulnificus (strain YJ016) TaxID=196600 RepID=Q7MJ55_VIBVY|nr:hypothetical protein [Vibrio vulnificus YJ016]
MVFLYRLKDFLSQSGLITKLSGEKLNEQKTRIRNLAYRDHYFIGG